jgi:hypothetical protein
MKSYGGVWHQIVSQETLYNSMQLAAHGKKKRVGVQQFLRDAE